MRRVIVIALIAGVVVAAVAAAAVALGADDSGDGRVPSVEGLSQNKAAGVLTEHGLKWQIQGLPTVYSEAPPAPEPGVVINPDPDENLVLEQEPEAGASTPESGVVVLTTVCSRSLEAEKGCY